MDDPLFLLMQGIWLMAAGMYPLGFLFGVCSACCNQCRNDTCEGFDLEEAFGGTRTSGRIELCDLVDNGGGVFESSGGSAGISAGCRVYGEGIAPGTVVTKVYGLYDPPREPFEFGDKLGCCEISYDSTIGPIQFGQPSCVEAQQVTERVVRTQQACEDRENTLALQQCFRLVGTGQNQQLVGENANSNFSRAWSECENCLVPPNPVGRPVVGGGVPEDAELVGYGIEIDPSPTGPFGPCLTFCGTGGKCGPFSSTSDPDVEGRFGPYGAGATVNGFTFYPDDYRRNCVRWVCRCYEGTGKKDLLDEDTGDPLFPNPSDWYTVASTTVVGGPTTNDLDLGEELENATGPYSSSLERDWLFDYEFWGATEGDIKCVVWAFVFYGLSEFVGICEPESLGPLTVRRVTPGDNVYFITPCNRCD
jgi:hypothetical protein